MQEETQDNRQAAGGTQWDSLAESLLHEYLQAHQEAMGAVLSQVSEPLQRVEALSKLSLALDRTFRALDRGARPPLPY